MPLAAFAAIATLVQAITSFALAQVVSIAAQRAITEMRKRVQAHVLRLPISYFDSTKTGVLISRIMSDAEGVRNLVGTGLIQLLGSVMTATDGAHRAFVFELEAHQRHAVRARRVRRDDDDRVRQAASRSFASAARSTPKSRDV